jgi:hypothetical protein
VKLVLLHGKQHEQLRGAELGAGAAQSSRDGKARTTVASTARISVADAARTSVEGAARASVAGAARARRCADLCRWRGLCRRRGPVSAARRGPVSLARRGPVSPARRGPVSVSCAARTSSELITHFSGMAQRYGFLALLVCWNDGV